MRVQRTPHINRYQRDLLYGLLKTLERHGLAGPLEERGGSSPRGPDEAVTWAVWDLGLLLWERLLGAGE